MVSVQKAQQKQTRYQKRVVSNTSRNLQKNLDTLILAPTGAGKTSMLAKVSANAAKMGKKTLILTHRKTLLRQMAGIEGRENEKEREGEIAWWTGIHPGQIAAEDEGGINEEPDIVIGMVETVSNRLGSLGDYGVIVIDETQHASKESSEREKKGSYSEIIDFFPDATLVATTATEVRGDEDELHARIKNAQREVVSIEEAREEGRVREVRTVIGRARLTNGRTPAEMAEDELAGRLDGRTASSLLTPLKGEEFYQTVVEDWERVCQRKPTLVFVDTVKEVDEMTALFQRRYGEKTAVCIHGGRKRFNDDAIESYASGEAGILISCQMIGEGFDVPATEAVMSCNGSLSRLEMNQYAGRCARTSPGANYGMFVDYGTASILHGNIEHQHALQNIDALSAAKSRVASAQAIGRAAPVSVGAWSVVPGEKKSIFFKHARDGYHIYEVDHRAERELGRRAKDSVSRLQRMRSEDGKAVVMNVTELGQHVAEHVRYEAGRLAREGGIDNHDYRGRCQAMLSHWQDTFKLIDAYETPTDAAQSRRQHIREDLIEGAQTGRGSWIVKGALAKAKEPATMLRESLDVAGVALEFCVNDDRLPVGRRGEALVVCRELDLAKLKEMSPAQMTVEGRQVQKLFEHLSKEGAGDTLKKVMANINEPLDQGVKSVEMMLRQQRAKKKSENSSSLAQKMRI